jgi:hypothetical protein
MVYAIAAVDNSQGRRSGCRVGICLAKLMSTWMRSLVPDAVAWPLISPIKILGKETNRCRLVVGGC